MSLKDTENRKRVPPEAKIIGRNLQKLRVARKLSRNEIAEMLGVSFQQIQKYESGQNRFPLDKLYRLKHYFDIPYEYFFTGLVDDLSDKKTLSVEDSKKINAVCEQIKSLKDKSFQQKICHAVQILIS